MALATPFAITYIDAQLGAARLATLKAVARDRETEVLETEVDCDEKGVFAHRFLFWPRDELSIDFGQVAMEIESGVDGRLPMKPYFVEINADTD